MIERRGSQFREPLEESDYEVLGRIYPNEIVLEDKENGDKHLYQQNDDFAGHVIVIDNIGYEFVRTALMGDLWWAQGKFANVR